MIRSPIHLLLALPFVLLVLAFFWQLAQAFWIEWKGGPPARRVGGHVSLTRPSRLKPLSGRVFHRWHQVKRPELPRIRATAGRPETRKT